jgi:hypothetical protein
MMLELTSLGEVGLILHPIQIAVSPAASAPFLGSTVKSGPRSQSVVLPKPYNVVCHAFLPHPDRPVGEVQQSICFSSFDLVRDCFQDF